jgi:hypothetical protein
MTTRTTNSTQHKTKPNNTHQQQAGPAKERQFTTYKQKTWHKGLTADKQHTTNHKAIANKTQQTTITCHKRPTTNTQHTTNHNPTANNTQQTTTNPKTNDKQQSTHSRTNKQQTTNHEETANKTRQTTTNQEANAKKKEQFTTYQQKHGIND